MSGVQSRHVFKSSMSNQREVRDILKGLFLSELLHPGERVWLASPWISDIVILDNRDGGFSWLDPSWSLSEIRLTPVLVRLMQLGTEVIIATRPDAHSEKFISQLELKAEELGCERLLTTHYKETLHIKGILGASFYLSGSMNITHNGITLWDEGITLHREQEVLGKTTLEYLRHFPVRLCEVSP